MGKDCEEINPSTSCRQGSTGYVILSGSGKDEQNAFLVAGSLCCGLWSNTEVFVFQVPVLMLKDDELLLSAKWLLAAHHWDWTEQTIGKSLLCDLSSYSVQMLYCWDSDAGP